MQTETLVAVRAADNPAVLVWVTSDQAYRIRRIGDNVYDVEERAQDDALDRWEYLFTGDIYAAQRATFTKLYPPGARPSQDPAQWDIPRIDIGGPQL